MSDYPRKAIEVRITANGFTWEQVIAALEERVARLREQHERGVGVAACGYTASHTAEVQLRDVTPDQFAKESIAWLDQRREERKKENAQETKEVEFTTSPNSRAT